MSNPHEAYNLASSMLGAENGLFPMITPPILPWLQAVFEQPQFVAKDYRIAFEIAPA